MAGIYTTVSTQVLGLVDGALGNQGAVVSAVTPLVTAGLTIWIAWFGWNTARGATGSYIVSDLIATIARVVLVLSVALAGGAYNANIAAAIKGAPAEFAGFMGVTVIGDLYSTLDASQLQVFTSVNNIYGIASKLPFSSLGLMLGLFIYSFVVGILLTIYLFLAACVMLGMDTSLRVIILLGPMFIAALAFPKTESFFYPWFNTAAATALGIAGLLLPLTITMSLFQGWINDIAIKGDPSNYDLVGVAIGSVAAVGLSYYLIIKLPQIIGGIIGSSVGGAGGIAQSMKSMMGTASNVLGAAAGAGLSKAAPSTASALGNALQATSPHAMPSNPFIRALQRGGGNMPTAMASGSLSATENSASNGSAANHSRSEASVRKSAPDHVPDWSFQAQARRQESEAPRPSPPSSVSADWQLQPKN